MNNHEDDDDDDYDAYRDERLETIWSAVLSRL
jgi:hypothetical protein